MTNDVIIESLKFVLKNNNVLFDDQMYLQQLGTAMGTECAPSYACLTVGYLGETKLFYQRTIKIFQWKWMQVTDRTIKTLYGWWFYPWAIKVKLWNFKTCLNNMQPSIKFTFEKPEIIYENEKKVEVLNFLDAKIILHEDHSVETDIYHKRANTHDYLPHDSTHPDHTRITSPTT